MKGMLIPDSSCSHASPLVVVHKNEEGIRMAVDYGEVNQFLRVSANQFPYQDMLFIFIRQANFIMLKWIIFGVSTTQVGSTM